MVSSRAIIIIFSLIKLSVTLNCNQRNVTNVETHLKLTLLCDYEPAQVPENFITINLLIELNELHPSSYLLYSQLYMTLKYNESSLAFDPKNYDNITEITVEIGDIWSPKLYFYDNLDHQTSINKCNQLCKIRFSGTVICKFTCYPEIQCDSNVKNWPNENQNCSFALFAINTYGDRVKFVSDINIDENFNHPNWKLLAYEVYSPDIKSPELYPVIGVSIAFEHYSYLEFYSTMYPIYSILVITFIAFALEFDSVMRITLIAVSIFLELHLVKPIEEVFYTRPNQLPIAVIYFRLTFGTSCFLISETLLLRSLTRKIIRAPQWFSHLEFLFKFGVFNLHVDSDSSSRPTEILHNLSADNLKWRLFCSILDRIFFIIWIIYNTYVMSF